MLKLKNITKRYEAGSLSVDALKGISLEFRKNEFVSVLGPSGCGKTTMLNIIGGLDRYTDGDLIINGKSTKTFKDTDWDSYRNHSIGFVFQSYNLIPHQSVLSNVELALTLSGVSKAERRRRAVSALESVGLGDQLHKRPSEMSGGQMQRVAIARALVNDPDILLADEPTGALDTATSVQIMEILKEISHNKLIIMVTHNPELAETYSSRIIKVIDGLVTNDSNPYSSESEEAAELAPQAPKAKQSAKKSGKSKSDKTSMSFFTALSLSFNNLKTKKGRTIMTSFAGSIGIIGIALILSLSTGINAFIEQVQEDTLSTYPLSIQKETQDLSAMLDAMTSASDTEDHSDSDMIYVDDSLGTMMQAMTSTVDNNLDAFKVHLDANYDKIEQYVSDIQYTYDYDMQLFNADGTVKVGMEAMLDSMGETFAGISDMLAMGGGMNVFSEMINNQELLDQQYEVIAGSWPEDATDVVLVVNSNNTISKMTLYMLGVLPHDDLEEIMNALLTEGDYDTTPLEPFEFEDFIDMKFRLLTTSDFFEESSKTYPSADGTVEYPVWNDVRKNPGYDQASFVSDKGVELKISGIIRPKEGATATSISGAVGYTKELTDLVLELTAESEIIAQQMLTPDVNVLTGLSFERTHYTPATIGQLVDKIDAATMEQFYAYMTETVKNDPEMSAKLKVTDENFAGMFMLMPAEYQGEILSGIIAAAKANDPIMTETIFTTVISGMTGNMINVTSDNFVMLLPSLDPSALYVTLAGMPATTEMPMPMPGIVALAGEEYMSEVYDKMDEIVLSLNVNEDIFVSILGTMNETDPNFITLEETLYSMAPQIDATYDSVLDELDDVRKASPASINFYAKDFESKDAIEQFIADYNDSAEETDKLEYTDLVGALMSSVTIIVNAISYVLIAFVAISLVVSSIMIGIITNISVLERTKEIGILRAIGASKKDVSRVFNAETMIIGFSAGMIGIIMTVLLCFPITAIVQHFTGLDNIRATLPWQAGIVLVIISVLLTLVAGIIPSRSAAKKDPVVALRSE